MIHISWLVVVKSEYIVDLQHTKYSDMGHSINFMGPC